MNQRVYLSFHYHECDEFVAYLTEMAAKGWAFRYWGLGLVFERCEPCRTEYAVTVFERTGNEVMRGHPLTEEYSEYCEQAGWQFVDAKYHFCIFKKVREDAIPIETTEDRFAKIVKRERVNIRRTCLQRAILGTLPYLWLVMWQDFPLGFYRLFGLALVLLAAFWFAICLVEYVSFARWWREGRRCILRGEMVYYGHRRREGQDAHFFRERRQLRLTGIGVLLLFVLMTVSGLRYPLYLTLFNVVIWLVLGCIGYRWSLTSGRKQGRMVRAGVTAVLSVSLLAMMAMTGIEPQWTYNRRVKRESIDAERAGLQDLGLSPKDYRQEETSLYFMPRVSGEIGLLGCMEKIDLAISEQYIVSYEQYYSSFTWLLEQTEQKLIVSGGW